MTRKPVRPGAGMRSMRSIFPWSRTAPAPSPIDRLGNEAGSSAPWPNTTSNRCGRGGAAGSSASNASCFRPAPRNLVEAPIDPGIRRQLDPRLVLNDELLQIEPTHSSLAPPLLQQLQDAMDAAPALDRVFLQLVVLVHRPELEHVAQEELERAEDERFELARAERVIRSELLPDLVEGPRVAEEAVEDVEVLRPRALMRDEQRGGRAVERPPVPGRPRQGDQLGAVVRQAGARDRADAGVGRCDRQAGLVDQGGVEPAV